MEDATHDPLLIKITAITEQLKTQQKCKMQLHDSIWRYCKKALKIRHSWLDPIKNGYNI
jgi:hypothetical protein